VRAVVARWTVRSSTSRQAWTRQLPSGAPSNSSGSNTRLQSDGTRGVHMVRECTYYGRASSKVRENPDSSELNSLDVATPPIHCLHRRCAGSAEMGPTRLPVKLATGNKNSEWFYRIWANPGRPWGGIVPSSPVVPVTQVRDRGLFGEVKPEDGRLLLRCEALACPLGHGRISARRCSLFEQTICPISTEAEQLGDQLRRGAEAAR
jgi:hypothetical protein